MKITLIVENVDTKMLLMKERKADCTPPRLVFLE